MRRTAKQRAEDLVLVRPGFIGFRMAPSRRSRLDVMWVKCDHANADEWAKRMREAIAVQIREAESVAIMPDEDRP